ncbi:hypothetical protein [uncultured Paludibaculum sp.]|uniref:hypothetical protein n=1 Tax=uncultured Paludibaculum sp. TaxID=1765020 RepID=UPI002AAB7864|nr:hypothetical protein [uncultured Paludibaculum sp.]
MNLQNYWLAIREMEADLTDPVFLADRKNGVVVSCDKKAAARYLVDGTHRLASDDEVIKHHARDKRRAEIAAAVERSSNRGVFVQHSSRKDV